MKTIEKQLSNIICYPISDEINPDEIIYFDIETTGLSADTSYLYMIGVLIQRDGLPFVIQWLIDDISEEKDLLQVFFGILPNYKLLIHYNGQTFDIPYLSKKAKRYQLDAPFYNMSSLDLYKKIRPLKKLLPLTDLKLKTLESYLGFNRKDIFSGEELIEIYAKYTGHCKIERLRPDIKSKEAEALRYILLLHNEEDLAGLSRCCFMLYCQSILNGDFKAEFTGIDHDTETAVFTIYPSKQLLNDVKEYFLITPLNFTFPPINYISEKEPILCIDAGRIQIKIPYFKGELKYFFEDYKDYYYLLEEDMAVHKCIGEHIDKAFRVKAKKSTCYQKKVGTFLPQFSEIFTPSFKSSYKDKVSCFELTDEFPDAFLINRYAVDILRQYI